MTRNHAFVALLLGSLLLVLAGHSVEAQVYISQKRVIISGGKRSFELSVSNPGSVPLEIGAEVQFNVIRSDSLGTSFFDSTGSEQEQGMSCHGWTKVFPRQLTLNPGEERSIRILASPPATLSEGEYRARLVISSVPVDAPIASSFDTTAITTHVRLRLFMSLPLIYRKGSVTAQAEIRQVTARLIDTTTYVLVDLGLKGNAAYRGTLFGIIRRTDGSVVDSVNEQFAAEIDYRQGLRFPRIADGSYRLDVRSEAVLRGSAQESVLPAAPVARSYTMNVSGSTIELRPREEQGG